MSQEAFIQESRARLRNQFGAALAHKASDAFCLAYGQRTVPVLEGFATGYPPPTITAVVEFKSDHIADHVKAIKQRRDLFNREFADAIREGQTPEGLAARAEMIFRQETIRFFRENVYHMVSHVRDELERRTGRLYATRAESMTTGGTPSALTQICWLNGTIRSWADPRALAEVASDGMIQRIGLPRLLKPELDVSANTIGSSVYRNQYNVRGKDIIVAVIDSEVNAQHPSLQGRVIQRRNFTNEPWGNPDVHGTAVAGIIGSDDARYVGVAPGATIYNYKVLATVDELNADDFGGALAIQHALEDGCRIANCSWGAGPARDGTSREAIACNTAWILGLTIVKSAGNGGPGSSTLTTPADAEGVIVVGAVDRTGSTVQPYSGRGPTLDGRSRPHLVAPGGEPIQGIMSCMIGGGFGDAGYGTSYAAPHVSGFLALILDQNPGLTPDQQRDILMQNCALLAVGDRNDQGMGLIRF